MKTLVAVAALALFTASSSAMACGYGSVADISKPVTTAQTHTHPITPKPQPQKDG